MGSVYITTAHRTLSTRFRHHTVHWSDMGNLIATCCGSAEYDTATAKSNHSNLSLSSSSIGSEKNIDQEQPSLPPSLPPRIQEKNGSSSQSSSSESEDEQEDVEDHHAYEENKDESFGQQTSSEEFRTELE